MSIKYITPAQHKSNLRNVYGTFAIEGMTISKDTRSNLDRIGSGQASYQQVVNTDCLDTSSTVRWRRSVRSSASSNQSCSSRHRNCGRHALVNVAVLHWAPAPKPF